MACIILKEGNTIKKGDNFPSMYILVGQNELEAAIKHFLDTFHPDNDWDLESLEWVVTAEEVCVRLRRASGTD